MSYNDQEEPSLPLSNNAKRSSADLLPKYYRTSGNKKFLQATLDQLTQPGAVRKINGFIGRQNAKAVKSTDIFVTASDDVRQNYQLEPTAIIQDDFENVTFFKDYIDYINQISVFGGNVSNHEKLNQQESYSWDPHINWDKFVNFQNYYWLPYGPDPISIAGLQQEVISTYSVNIVDEGDNYAFLFSPDGLTRNPTLTLYRGQTYKFQVNSPNNPFSIKTSRITGNTFRYTKGITGNGITSGVLTFEVPNDAPDVLFYVSENDGIPGGTFQVANIEENTFLEVNEQILGKQNYTTSTGIPLSNGMKLKFTGKVSPTEYSQGYWYVEGVGSEITLIPETELEVVTPYTQNKELLFDDGDFDRDPFSSATTFPSNKDYITMARGSIDRNPWSRYNRWFHKDIIQAAADAQGSVPEFDQSQRANRPIIEFEANLKLYNFGYKAKPNVDLVDTFTKDVFSTIEGSLGYNIDGVDLVDGMRVLFTADTDRLVKDRIFKVNFIKIIVPSRQINFNAATTINIDTDVISFTTPHSLTTGDRLVYLNNGNSNIKGLENRKIYYAFVLNSLQIKLYTDKLFTVPVDIYEVGKGTHKFELFSGIRRQINLVEEPDSIPNLNDTVLVKFGLENQGYMYWYNGSDWKFAQQKTEIGQAPLFDIFDSNGVSYGDTTVYDSSTFKGNKLFSYKIGEGAADANLNFALSYRNINNVGDIVFKFDLLNDSITYKEGTVLKTKNTDVGYLKKVRRLSAAETGDEFSYVNGWTKTTVTNLQPIVRIFKNSNLVNDFPIDVYDDPSDLNDLEVRVYINGIRLSKNSYVIASDVVRKIVRLNTDVTTSDVVTLKCFAKQRKNQNGYYQIPLNFQNNPLNNNLKEFTLGEVIDHVESIIENINDFEGSYPGAGNLRDLGNVTSYGLRFLQHSGPLNLALYHFGQKNFNVFKALDLVRNDYGNFKRNFLLEANRSGVHTNPRDHLDIVLSAMSKDQPKNKPYYLSDMFGFSSSTKLEYVIEDPNVKFYPISKPFNLNEPSNRAVYIYLNGEQLIHGKDYEFGTDVYFTVKATLAEDDLLEVYEYDTTDGSFCPNTPTALGLYPKFEPAKYIDDTYLEPREVIQGHDGSITLCYGDFRDDLLLELEKRIYNNIKVNYDPSILDIYDLIPGYSRETVYSKIEFDTVLSKFFYQWTTLINEDYTQQTYWDRLNSFTFNYRGNYTPDGRNVPAFWRGIYDWTLDTDRPHTHPWECLNFNIKPEWWEETYGPAPYTSDNRILWDDIKDGIIREPGKPIRIIAKLAKTILAKGLPVNTQGELISPSDANFVQGPIAETPEGFYIFGDQGPVETAWRRSSYYPFAIIQTLLLLQPNKVLATYFDRSRIERNLVDQLVYKETGLRIRLQDIVIPSNINSSDRIYSSGLVNYIIDYINSDITILLDNYKNDLQRLENKIGSKLGAFTSTEKLKLLLDSKSPTSTGGIFVPQENYNVFLNTSSPLKKVVYSGVIITKFADGFEIRGYNLDDPYFIYHPYRLNDGVVRVGGISESFSNWTENKDYVAGKVVQYQNRFYRTKTTHTSGSSFDPALFARLAELPQSGGKEAIIRKGWDYDTDLVLAYGTKLPTIQDVADFIQGYGAYLSNQGFIFDSYNPTLKLVTNWNTSLKEFLFWTTQNWDVGAVLALSPAADQLVFRSENSVVNDILDPFYGYAIYRVDGQLLTPNFTNAVREGNDFSLNPTGTNHGIYGAVLYTIQKEHALILDNVTLFNDVIYDLEPGYRQERIKVLGYVSTNWNGSFNIPGFVFDQAKINEWELWTDYQLGDIVKYKEFYYAAKKFLPGTEKFNADDWAKLEEKPTSRMLPNLDYKAEQFTDFYDLDSDNFDAEQQRLAQHLIGYQNRQYLENIIKDDVSQYKFYQGMIIEKGTQNVLSKLFDVLSADDQESLSFNEEWALRVGEYGAVDAFEEIEFKLDEKLFKLTPQAIELTTDIDRETVDYVIRQTPSDIYVRPIAYNNNPFPLGNYSKYLRSPGYVRYDDVQLSINSLDDLLAEDIESYKEGDYIWCAFDTTTNNYWNVYRLTNSNFEVESVTYLEGVVSVTFTTIPEFTVGSIIGIDQSTLINGFYKVKTKINRTVTFEKEVTAEWPDPFVEPIVIFELRSNKISNLNEANDYLPVNLKNNELIWVDNNGQGLSAVYANNSVYSRLGFETPDKQSNLKFGIKTTISKDGTIAAVTTANNSIYIFNKSKTETVWTQTDFIEPNLGIASSNNLGFGLETAFSPDGEWLAVAAPTASYVKSGWQGQFSSSTPYNSNDIVRVKSTHWAAKRTIPGDSSADSFDNDPLSPTYGQKVYDEFKFRQDWKPAYLVSADGTKSSSSRLNEGYVSIYQRIGANKYRLADTFVSPEPTANEKFGSKLSFAIQGDEYVLAVSSPGYEVDPSTNRGRGRVYMFRYGKPSATDTIPVWRMDYNRNYVGAFNSENYYYPGDIVLNTEDYQLYRCLAEQDPTPISTNPSAWQLITNTTNLLGFFPQVVTDELETFVEINPFDSTFKRPGPLFKETVEQVMAGDVFGYDVKISANNGDTLIISAPYADDLLYGNFKGKWRAVITYNPGDIVYHLGGFWKFVEDSNLNEQDFFVADDWELLNLKNYTYKGLYDQYQTYFVGDVVYDVAGGKSTLYQAVGYYVGDGSSNSDPAESHEFVKLFPRTPNTGKVFVYKFDGSAYALSQTIGFSESYKINKAERLGESIAISDNAEYIAVSSTLSDKIFVDQGKVVTFKLQGSVYEKQQDLFSHRAEPTEKFGSLVEFMNDADTLVVYSAYGDIQNLTTIDNSTTLFDNGTMRFVDVQRDTGRVDIYDKYDVNYIYGESLSTPYIETDSTVNDLSDKYGYSIAVGANNILVAAPLEDGELKNVGRMYSYVKPVNTFSWAAKQVQQSTPDAYKIKKAYLYNRLDNKLITYLDVVDPVQGKIPGVADQEIKYKTYFDPAIYVVGTSAVNVDEGLSWTDKQVGTLWWDLNNAKFLEYSVGEIVFRSANWNKLYKTGSIDIYEWVETKYLPAEWNQLSGTEEGFALGISGVSKYDNTVYSLKRRYDSVSQTFINTYYYWVKNPSIMPSVEGRLLPASDVSALIADPVAYGYPCLALLGTDSFNLVNVTNLLEDSNVILNVQYWLIDDYTKNVHTQWKVVSENEKTVIPAQIENKWFDSLIGKDEQSRVLPDPRLPAKLKYGIESRPRQSMFVNRIESLKQFIERVNSVLTKELIVDKADLTDLFLAESAPKLVTGLYDKVIDTEEELRFIGTSNLVTAILTPIIIDGRIVGADIVNKGFGYINPPAIKIIGTGKDANLKVVLDEFGRISSVVVEDSGQGYLDSTYFVIRPYAVLVTNDSESLGRWSIYNFNKIKRNWVKVKTQGYDVTPYWDYIDWYKTGYTQFTQIDFVVNNTYELSKLEAKVGDIVKVSNVGTGGWMLLEKFANNITIDYTENYSVVARQNGTINFKSNLYSFKNTTYGYDGALYDSNLYDIFASVELRIIINTIKNKILINDLRIEYLKLFFASVRYALNEQFFIDWAIKTSFVKATHNAGYLKEKVNYNNDNLQDFESYVKEVKPFRTKVREYVSSYNQIDNSQTSVTDFDLLPVINPDYSIVPLNAQVLDDGSISYNDENMLSYPWKHWYDNVGFNIESIVIADGGSGYINRPVVRIRGGFGSGAEAKAYTSNGKVNRIDLIKKGSGYLKAPEIIVDGGLAEGGTPAKAVAVIENSVVRSNKISVKFDRITKNYYVTELTSTEYFKGNNTRKQFELKFSPDTTVGKSIVKINGVEALRDDYVLSTKKSVTKGFTSYAGVITFDTAPPAPINKNQNNVEITYTKDFNHLSATDRINFYYNPQSGQFGKDLAQLMTGIDFGGVNITGLGFEVNGGWDSLPWYSEGWDGFDAEFDDYVITVSDSTYAYQLPYVPALNEQINVYVNGKRIDDPYFDSYDGITVQPNGKIVAPAGTYMQTFIGNGVNDTIILPTSGSLDINTGDKIVFRRSTSDGSYAPDPALYDTQLSGGNLAYTTATGLAPDDITLDGDTFISPAHSNAPEEVVPGQISDAVAIKVFRLPRTGSNSIIFYNHVCDGVQFEFLFGQYTSNLDSVFVKYDGLILKQGTDYELEWETKVVRLNFVPDAGKTLSTMSFGFGGQNILDINYFVSDGSTSEFITDAPWPTLSNDATDILASQRIDSVVLVNGIATPHELFKTDETYISPNRVGLRIGGITAENSIINYVITADNNNSLSTVHVQQLPTDGATVQYLMPENTVGIKPPFENNILVVKNGEVLTPANNINFVMEDNQYVYTIPSYKTEPYTINPSLFAVYVDGEELSAGSDYQLSSGFTTITINKLKYKEGAILTLLDFTSLSDYSFVGSYIIFSTIPTLLDDVRIISFYNHDVQKVIRSLERFDVTTSIVPGSVDYFTYMSQRGGAIKLQRSVFRDDYIWVIKNKRLLSHSIDFYLDDDFRTIKFAQPIEETDKFDIILFNDIEVTTGYGWMQFKDMLNRVHYKRIRKQKSTRLGQDLHQRATEIVVEDGSVLSKPNINMNMPGIIEINGERIEYFELENNILRNLRRGTLGTGVPTTHVKGSYVMDFGPSETIPYNDQHIVETYVNDGSTRIVPLNYVPTVGTTNWYRDTIPEGYGQSNELEVFVGGYRLKKVPYKLYEEANGYPYSPEGDSQYEAEFSVNGTSSLRLTNNYPENSKVVVIKKTGRIWEDADNPVEIYRDVQAAVGGASFDVFKTNSQYVVQLKNPGINYNIGDIITLPGEYLGGKSPENDIVITVTDITTSRGDNKARAFKIYPGNLYSDAPFLTAGVTYVIDNPGTTDFTTVGASSNTPGTVFVATGPATGNGRAFDLIDNGDPKIQTFSMLLGTPDVLWKGMYFEGNGAKGYITYVDLFGGNKFNVYLDEPLDDLVPINLGEWRVWPLKVPTKSIRTFTYTGQGQYNGFVAKSLADSNNSIANFIKNTEALFPTYIGVQSTGD